MKATESNYTFKPAAFFRALSHKVSYYTLLGIFKALSYLPFWTLFLISDIIYYFMYYCARYRGKIVRKNLTECFPGKSKKEIIAIEKKFYRFLVDVIFESCKLFTLSPKAIEKRISFANVDKINQMLKDGRSISAYLGHYGNWEWMATTGLFLYKGAVSAQIYHKLKSKPMDMIVKRLRERMGNKCIDMNETVRFMAKAVDDPRPYIIGFVSDQSPRRREAKYFIPFLNHSVPVLTGTEKATKHYDYAAVFISMRRVKRGYYKCEFVLMSENPKTLPDFQLTDMYFDLLEKEILKNPEYYLWTHKRFKFAQKLWQSTKS